MRKGRTKADRVREWMRRYARPEDTRWMRAKKCARATGIDVQYVENLLYAPRRGDAKVGRPRKQHMGASRART